MKDDSISLVHAAVMAMVSSPDFVAELQKRIHAVAPAQQATNTGSPKLPTLVECERWYIKEKCGFEHITELEKNVIREVHDYLCRQLRAGA